MILTFKELINGIAGLFGVNQASPVSPDDYKVSFEPTPSDWLNPTPFTCGIPGCAICGPTPAQTAPPAEPKPKREVKNRGDQAAIARVMGTGWGALRNIAKYSNVPEARAKAALSRMKYAGLVETSGDGYWDLTDDGEAYADKCIARPDAKRIVGEVLVGQD